MAKTSKVAAHNAQLFRRLPSVEDVASLRYTEMVLSESMRLFPPAWAIGRMAKGPFELGGIPIAGKSICIVSPYVMQHDARWFPDPERFDPDRWLPEVAAGRPPTRA